MRKPPSPSPSDLKSFKTYCDWRTQTQGIAIPEAEWRNDFAENPDGSVGERITPAFVPQAIMAVGYPHDYSQIRVPVLAFVGYSPLPRIRFGKPTSLNQRNGSSSKRLRDLRRHDQESNKENRAGRRKYARD